MNAMSVDTCRRRVKRMRRVIGGSVENVFSIWGVVRCGRAVFEDTEFCVRCLKMFERANRTGAYWNTQREKRHRAQKRADSKARKLAEVKGQLKQMFERDTGPDADGTTAQDLMSALNAGSY